MDKINTSYDIQTTLFYVFHAVKTDVDYVVHFRDLSKILKDLSKILRTDEDKHLSFDEMKECEKIVEDWINTLHVYSNVMMWTNYSGVQWNFYLGNRRLFGLMYKKALDENNPYLSDFLVNDLIRGGFLSMAKVLYKVLEEHNNVPFNSLYQAALFDNYETFFNSYSDPIGLAYQFGLNAKKVLAHAESLGYGLDDNKYKMLIWASK